MSWKHSLICSGMAATSIALFAGNAFARDLYWSEEKKIFAADIDGGNVTAAPIFDGDLSTPVMGSYIVDIDVTDDYIYWTGHNGGDVWRADRDGGNATQIVSDTGYSIHFLEVDEAAGKIYFGDFGGRILEADLNGGNVSTVFSDSAMIGLSGITTDATVTGSQQFLALSSSNSWLYRIEGGSIVGYEELEGGTGNYGIVQVPSTNTVYYTNHTESTLRSYDLRCRSC